MWSIGTCLIVLQSFAFTAVYFGLQIRNDPYPKFLNGESYCSMLTKRISNRENIADREETVAAGKQATPIRRRSFSIFDGSGISLSPWGAFLIDDDNESDKSNDSDDELNFDIELAISNDQKEGSNSSNSADVMKNTIIEESKCEEDVTTKQMHSP
uniref:Uncharacterized protein n=1 Tax=Eucampia antarctica TaxID=49252 RepID=A0A7S2VZA0_9STRA|mmetsp:Transcript_12856/g.12464  ORF Transcript_12856/g.12464 Transcript_12856/m.12464 type:complete len:156 (+) Transcript_12856:708-1175(+)